MATNFHDYAHAARYYGCGYEPETPQPSDDTERLYALKVITEACGYDIPDALFDDLTYSIDQDASDFGDETRSSENENDWHEEIERVLAERITLPVALAMVPDIQRQRLAYEERRHAVYQIGRFAASLGLHA